MPVVTVGKDAASGEKQLWFDCPGCGFPHRVPVGGSGWTWNGDVERPTLSPSVMNSREYGPERVKQVCHFFLRDGRIEYCADSTHELAGKTVAMAGV